MRKKILTLILTATVALSFAGCGSSGADTPSVDDTKAKVKDVLKDASSEEESKVVEEHYEVDLSAGNYAVGIDIPVGTYNLTATGGTGNVSSSNMYTGGLNEIMGSPAEEGYSVDAFSGLKLASGDTLSLGGTVTLHATSENAQVSGITARTATDAAAIDLGPGNYTVGTDFPAGTYNIVGNYTNSEQAFLDSVVDDKVTFDLSIQRNNTGYFFG